MTMASTYPLTWTSYLQAVINKEGTCVSVGATLLRHTGMQSQGEPSCEHACGAHPQNLAMYWRSSLSCMSMAADITCAGARRCER